MENNRRKVFKSKDIKKPFKSYDVSAFDEIFIDGSSFPIKLTSSKLTIKGQRELKKPALIEEMPNNLKLHHNVTFTKKEEEEALNIFKTTNYYRISVFSEYLDENRSFTRILELYRFDSFLRESINRLIPPIEIALKTTLSYFLAMNYKQLIDEPTEEEGLVYLDYSIFKNEFVNNGKVNEMLAHFAEFFESKQDKDPSIKHHVEYYGGQIPIWVLVEHLTLGDIATFVTYLDRPIRKKWVDFFMKDIKDKWIIEWIKTIQFLRNSGAHCSRFYGKMFNYNPQFTNIMVNQLPEDIKKEQRKIDKLQHTFFAGLLIMKNFYMILPKNERENWNIFLDKLDCRIKKYSADTYRIGFTNNWYDMLKIVDE
ncbi:Abi family protein [Enterococcus faecalis]|nr:Abi family protein [Enterococcus faecalis]